MLLLVQNKTRRCLRHFFIEKVEKISSIKTLKIWKTQTQTETENQVIYTHGWLNYQWLN